MLNRRPCTPHATEGPTDANGPMLIATGSTGPCKSSRGPHAHGHGARASAQQAEPVPSSHEPETSGATYFRFRPAPIDLQNPRAGWRTTCLKMRHARLGLWSACCAPTALTPPPIRSCCTPPRSPGTAPRAEPSLARPRRVAKRQPLEDPVRTQTRCRRSKAARYLNEGHMARQVPTVTHSYHRRPQSIAADPATTR